MDPTPALLLGVLLPASVCGLILASALGLWRPTAQARRTAWPWPMALGLGYAAGHVALIGLPPFPPVEAVHWVLVVVLAMAIVQAGLSDAGHREQARNLATSLLLGVAVFLLLRPLLHHSLSPGTAIGKALLVGVVWFATALLLGQEARRQPSENWLGLCFLTGLGVSGTILFTGSALLAQLAGVCVATLGATLVLALWNRSLRVGPGAAPVLTMTQGALWFAAHLYSEMPGTFGALLALGPALGALGGRLAFAKRSRLAASVATLVPAALPVALAVALAARDYFADDGLGY